MLNAGLVRDRFGQYYKINTNKDKPAPNSLVAEWFSNEIQASRFIENLVVPTGYWSSILLKTSLSNRLPHNRLQLNHRIAELLKRGKIKVYKIEIPSFADHPPEKRTILVNRKNKHTFASSTILLTTNPKEVLIFSNKNEALKYLGNISVEKEKLQEIANELGLPKTQSDSDPEVLLDKIATVLATGEIIVIVDRYTTPPRPEESLTNLTTFIDKKADLGPPPDEFKEINIELEDEFEQTMANHFDLFNGLQYTLKTDMGEEHKGTIENGKIQIPKARMNSSFEIEIKDMPTFLAQ